LKKIYIIGAGVSGLVLALELLKKGLQVEVFEAKSNVGGLASTLLLDDLPIDSGPHLFHTSHDEILEYWKDILGEKLVAKGYYSANYIDGKLYDYPFNLEALEKQFDADEREQILLELESAKLTPELTAQAKSYKEYVSGLCGPLLANKFFTNYPRKLWGLDTHNLSARFAPKRIEIREKRLPFHSGPGKFAGVIEGGCGIFAAEVAKRVDALGGIIHRSTPVLSLVKKRENISRIVTKSKSFDCGDSIVVSTIPLDKLAEMLEVETKLYYRKCLCVYILTQGEDPFPKEYDWIYFPDEDSPFHRVGVQTRFSREGFKSDQHLLCCEIGYEKEITQEQLIKLQAASLDYLIENGFLNREHIVKTGTLDLGSVYPGYYIGHETDLKKINSKIYAYNNLLTLGSLAEYAYSDLQVLTAKAIDLAESISNSYVTPVKSHSPARELMFDGVAIGEGQPTYTIAEIGLNHNGSVTLCKKLITECANGGFSAVKFQTYTTGRLSKKTKSSRYFEETLDQEESLSDYLDRIIFNEEELRDIFSHANDCGITCFSTPFDLDSVDLLEGLNVPGYKISSMDINNENLIRIVASKKKPVLISTGMATFGDIEHAIQLCLDEGNTNLAILHCVSAYPCDISLANLSRITRIKNAFDVITGYSDHTEEAETPSLAVMLNASIIEKHVTLDKNFDGPDHAFSLIPQQFSLMNDLVKKAYLCTSATGALSAHELKARQNLRRSAYAAKDIFAGSELKMSDVVIKSPGDGIDPREIKKFIGAKVKHDIGRDTPILLSDFFDYV